jgi:hypothetical protein
LTTDFVVVGRDAKGAYAIDQTTPSWGVGNQFKKDLPQQSDSRAPFLEELHCVGDWKQSFDEKTMSVLLLTLLFVAPTRGLFSVPHVSRPRMPRHRNYPHIPSSSSSASSSSVSSSRMTMVPARMDVDPLREEILKEDTRAAQLKSLYEAFQSAVEEKKELLALETGILAQMGDVRSTVTDASILSELEAVIAEKRKQIDAETAALHDISGVTAALAEEIAASSANVETLRQHEDVSSPGADTTLVNVSEWARARDERVLSLINRFNDITQKNAPSGFTKDAVDADDDGAGIRLSAPVTPAPSLNDVTLAIRSKSNTEIAEVAGSAFGNSGVALVALTSCLITATATFITSSSGQLAGKSVGSAAVALGESARGVGEAWEVLTSAYDGAAGDNRTTPSSTADAAADAQRIFVGVQAAIGSAELKGSFAKVGGKLQLAAAEAGKAVDLAVAQVGGSLSSSEKFAAAVSTLATSLITLIAIVRVATSRAVEEVGRQLSRELPEGS